MESEQFDGKIRALRQLWDEKRQTAQLSTGDEFATRFDLLRLIHRWLEESLVAIARHYGEAVGARLGPLPSPENATDGFTLTIFESYVLKFRLASRKGPVGEIWTVVGEAGNLGSRPMLTALGPTRRHGQWTRERIEQILLSILSQFERDRYEPDRAGSAHTRRAQLARLTLPDFGAKRGAPGA